MMPEILLQNPNNNEGRDMEMKDVHTYITGFFGKMRFAAHQTVVCNSLKIFFSASPSHVLCSSI